MSKCRHKHKMYIGESPENTVGKNNSEIWKCYSCEKFILVKTIQDWKNAKAMTRKDFEGRSLVDQEPPLLTDVIQDKDLHFLHHSDI